MKLLFVRHGETDWNAEGRFQGREDIPLNTSGIMQAQRTADFLADVPLNAVYVSPLSRAVKTAEAIMKYHPGITAEQDIRLIENDLGLIAGLLPAEREAFYATGKPTLCESEESSVSRMTDAVMSAYSLYPNGTVLFVSHGGLINRLLRSLDIRGLVLTNGCVIETDVCKSGIRFVRFNDFS